MPIYEYSCKACEHRFEELVPTMNAVEKPACPECGSKQTSRILSTFAVAKEANKMSDAPRMCGRCGGPGPCALPE